MSSLENLVKAYQPNEAAIELVRQTRIVLVVGIAGAGKDTIKQRLLAAPDYHDIISHTTREPRRNNGVLEKDGSQYHFIDAQTAENMVRRHEFVEAKFVHGTVYGTSCAALADARSHQQIAITDLDVQGVEEYKAISKDVVAIFIVPPTYEIWRMRLRNRYETEVAFEQEWPKRRASAIRELEIALSVPYYHFVINDDLETSVEITDEIAHKRDTFHRKDDEVRLKVRDLLDDIRTRAD